MVVTRFATSRTALLLARLALQPGRAHPREELIDLLWPEADLDSGRNRLRVILASLRRQLEPPGVSAGSVLVADRAVVRLNPVAFRCDVAEFEAALTAASLAPSAAARRDALARAASLYAGDLLPGLYDEWVIEERERLTALSEEADREWRSLQPADVSSVPSGAAETPIATPVAVASEATDMPMVRLPLPFTRFFGREQETAELAEMLRDTDIRLVTLTGPGGVGKTRLAVEAVRRAADSLGGPVCFVPLADLTDAGLLPAAVAAALRLAAGIEEPFAMIAGRLAGAHSLLLLDNLEHLGEAGALQIRALLEHVPGVTCLVTAQGRLGLEGEREFPVAPLPTPAAEGTPVVLIASPSVRLFVDRAQAVRPDFQVTDGNAEAVAAVCRDLEGLPLALELAAARIGALTPRQMREQLKARLDFLSGRRRDLPMRHRSLRAALEWSEQLLTPELSRFFRRLCVFRGGWTLEAAGAVCAASSDLQLLDQMEGLRERSLITAEETEHGMRFRMLEALREFGLERLLPDERRALGRRHADYFAAVAAQMGVLWYGPEQRLAQETLDAELDNLRAALAFCRDDPPDADWDGGLTALRTTGWLGDYWVTRGMLREGLEWLEGVQTAHGAFSERARALEALGNLAAGMGLYDRAEAALTEALAISRDAGDGVAVARALRRRGIAALWRQDYMQAADDLGESLALGRVMENDVIIGNALINLGNLAHHWDGDDAAAGALYEEALSLVRREGDRQRTSYCLYNLGNIAHDAGDDVRAAALVEESMALAESLGDVWHRAFCLLLTGQIAMTRGDMDAAQVALEESRGLFHRVGDRRMEADTLCALASVVLGQNAPSHAEAAYEAALALRRELDDAPGMMECRIGLAELAAAAGRHADAARWLGAVARQDLPASLCARFDAVASADLERHAGEAEGAQSQRD
jgi:predicted ATPase